MVGMSRFNMDLKDDVSSCTVSELISSLKSAFQNAYFSQVEAVLISREEKLKREIELLKKENDWLAQKMETERLEKEMAKKECLELHKEISSLQEEKAGFHEKLKSLADDKKTVIELEAKLCELECAKLRAENEARACKINYEGLEIRVYKLDQEMKELKSFETGGENVAANVKIEGDETTDVKIEKDATRCDESAHLELSQSPSFHHTADMNNRTGGGRPLSEDIVEIIDSDDDSSAPSKILSAKEMASSGEQKGLPSGQRASEYVIGALKRKWVSSVNKGGIDNGENDVAQDVAECCSTGKEKISKAQKLFPVANSSPIEHSSSSSSSSDSDVDVDLSIY
ncbi:uncharacterized protein LOC8287737 [Ricinus communis]|uniref:uncharacterized protein LOC8287737 n=1 Tax=Ricinus communis TaxID=3988 RepID=UPI00201AB478|nr:uncharacterized protein LOC8287737 [Ricinus communis]